MIQNVCWCAFLCVAANKACSRLTDGLATGGATRRIKDSQTITVDGGAGTVELK